MTQKALKEGRVTKNKQDRSREFISLLAYISAVRKSIPPLLIYKGTLGDLREGWVEDITPESGVFFASSENR